MSKTGFRRSIVGSKDYSKAHKGEITAIASSDKHLFTADRYGTIKQFSLEGRNMLKDFGKVHLGEIYAIDCSGDFVFTTDENGYLKQFSAINGSLVNDYGKIHQGEIWSQSCTKDCKYVFTSDFEGNLKQFDANKLMLKKDFGNLHTGHIYQIISSKNSKWVLTSDFEGYLKQVDVEKSELAKDHGRIFENHITAICVTHDSKYAFACESQGSVKLFDVNKKELLKDFSNLFNGEVHAICSSLDSKYVFIADRKGHLKQIGFRPTVKVVCDYGKIHQGEIRSLACNDEYVFVPDNLGNFKQFDMNEKQISRNYGKLHTNGIDTVIVRGDNLIIMGEKGLLMQYSIKDDNQIMAHVKEHEEMKKRSAVFDKEASDISAIKTNNVSVITFPNESTIKKTTLVDSQNLRSIEDLGDSQEWGPKFIQENYNVEVRQTAPTHSHSHTQMPPKPVVTGSTKVTSHTHYFHKDNSYEQTTGIKTSTNVKSGQYMETDLLNKVSSVLIKFNEVDKQWVKVEGLEFSSNKLKNKFKAIKEKMLLLDDVDTKIRVSENKVMNLDKLDHKTEKINQKLEAMNILLSKIGYGGNILDTKMKAFVDEVVQRLYGTIGNTLDHTETLQDHMNRLEAVDIRFEDQHKKADKLSNLPTRFSSLDSKIINFEEVNERVGHTRTKLDEISHIDHQCDHINGMAHDLSNRFDRLKVLEEKIDEIGLLFSKNENLELKIDSLRGQVDGFSSINTRTGLEETVKDKLVYAENLEAKLDELRAYLNKITIIDTKVCKIDQKLDLLATIDGSLDVLDKKMNDGLILLTKLDEFELHSDDLKSKISELKEKVEAMSNLEFRFNFQETFEKRNERIDSKLGLIENQDIKTKNIENTINMLKGKLDRTNSLELKFHEIYKRLDGFDAQALKSEGIENKMQVLDELEAKASVIEHKVYKLDDLEHRVDDLRSKLVKLDTLEYRIRAIDTNQLAQSNAPTSQSSTTNNKLSIAIDGQEGKTKIEEINMNNENVQSHPIVESKLNEIDSKINHLKNNMKTFEAVDHGSEKLKRDMDQLKVHFDRLGNLEKKTKNQDYRVGSVEQKVDSVDGKLDMIIEIIKGGQK